MAPRPHAASWTRCQSHRQLGVRDKKTWAPGTLVFKHFIQAKPFRSLNEGEETEAASFWKQLRGTPVGAGQSLRWLHGVSGVQVRSHSYLCFADMASMVQRGQVICPRSHSEGKRLKSKTQVIC